MTSRYRRRRLPPRKLRFRHNVELMRYDVINELLGTTRERWYLEIGVQRGVCGARIEAEVKCGVDPKPVPGAEKHYTNLYPTTSDKFFEALPEHTRFDVVLVDGLHHAEQVLRDVENALRFLSDDGFIVLHDCNPQTELAQRVPREVGVWNGDCWRAMVELRQREDLDCFTIDADHGVGVVRRRRNQDPLPAYSQRLTYSDLAANRQRLLDLTPAERWTERLGPPLALGVIAVVSANFGWRDEPKPAPAVHDCDRFIMFTDGPEVDGWEIRRDQADGDPRLAARKVKTLAFDLVDADVIVWMDGRLQATGAPVRKLLRGAFAEADIAGFPHPWRDCAYAEAAECAELGLAPRERLQAQEAAYRAAGLPEHAGLWNTMVLARKRTEATFRLGRDWWQEIRHHTVRDQVSLPFLLWRDGLDCGVLGEDVYRVGASPYWRRGHHARDEVVA